MALDPPHGLFLDITGCAHLFGGEARAAADRVRRADPAGLCRQRRDRRAPSVCARTLTRHVSGQIVADGEEAEAVSPLPVSALGAGEAITARPAPRRAEDHRRCRLARAATKSRRGSARDFTTLLEQALGQGDAPISPRKAAAGLHRRETLSRTGRHRQP